MAILPIVIRKAILGKEIILIVRSNDRFFDFEFFPSYQKILHRWMSRHIDGVIAVSDMIKGYVEKNSECLCRKVDPFLMKESFLEIEPDLLSSNVVSIGTHYPRKGNDILMEVDKKLRQDGFSGETYILGSKEGIPSYIKKYEVKEPKFHLIGYTDPKPYLKKSTFYVHPARFDAAPNSVLEAMAAGLIPIVSENTGNKNMVHKVSPELVLQNEVVEYYSKINELIDKDEKEMQKMSGKAKEVASEYTFERAEENFKKSVKELVEKAQEEREYFLR